MIIRDKRPFERLAEELSSTVCHDCGKTHEVKFTFNGDTVLYASVPNCVGFNDLVAKRFKTLYNLEMKRLLLGL